MSNIEVFVFMVEPELETMDRERVDLHRLGQARPRHAAAPGWTDLDPTFGSLWWRIVGWLSGAPLITLHSAFALRAVAFRWCRGEECPDKPTRARRAASNKELRFDVSGRRLFASV